MLTLGVAYNDGKQIAASDDISQLRINEGFCWIGLSNPIDNEINQLATDFDLHDLMVEDVLHGMQRPKVEDYGDHEFVIVKTLHYEDSTSQVETGELAVCIGRTFVITVQRGNGVDIEAARQRLEADPRQLAEGPYAVLHAILDSVVDQYQHIAYELENDVANIEHKVFSNASRSWAQELYFLKREIIEYRRAVDPMRLIIDRILVDQALLLTEVTRPFFRDILDHAVRAADLAAGLDQLLTAAMNADIAQVQIRQNEDMRKISAYVALAAVPTLLAGVWGMNFDAMPELHESWGYPFAIAVMIATCTALYRKFKRSGWL